MSDLLLRNMPDATKRRLKIRAAENGRSLSAEAMSILEEALYPAKKTWFEMLYETAQEVGGIDFPIPERHPAREFTFQD